MPDPKNKKQTERGQMLSDKRASLVARGKLTYEQARAKDEEDDAKVRKTKSVLKKTSGSSQGLASKRKSMKPKFSYDRYGKLRAN
jgi:hypothetical protein